MIPMFDALFTFLLYFAVLSVKGDVTCRISDESFTGNCNEDNRGTAAGPPGKQGPQGPPGDVLQCDCSNVSDAYAQIADLKHLVNTLQSTSINLIY